MRRLTVYLSALLLLATLTPTSAAAASATPEPRITHDLCLNRPDNLQWFRDVDDSNVHRDMIWCADAVGVVSGTEANTADHAGTYDPSGTLRRDQLASFVARVLYGSELQNGPSQTADYFDDDDGNVHETAINMLADAGVVDTDSRTFGVAARPDRAEMAELIARTIAFSGNLDLTTPTANYFTDDDRHPAARYIDQLARTGVITGTGTGRYDPTATLRRDQMAAFLVRALDLIDDNGNAYPGHDGFWLPEVWYDMRTSTCQDNNDGTWTLSVDIFLRSGHRWGVDPNRNSFDGQWRDEDGGVTIHNVWTVPEDFEDRPYYHYPQTGWIRVVNVDTREETFIDTEQLGFDIRDWCLKPQ